jgi:hypothetical protein
LGLWESFIVEQDGEKRPSDYFYSAALQTGSFNDTGFGDMNAFCALETLQLILVGIAQQQLPQHIGTAFSEWVVCCLTIKEGGSGNTALFEGKGLITELNIQSPQKSPPATFK